MTTTYERPPYGETLTDERPAVLSWDRCDAYDADDRFEGYFGCIFDVDTNKVIYLTPVWPVKSLCGKGVVAWFEDNGYTYNEQSWDWERN